MAGTTIMSCNCKSEFQDEKYGKNRRLANLSESGKTSKCTVCGNKHGGTTKK